MNNENGEKSIASGRVSDRPFARVYFTLGARQINGQLTVVHKGKNYVSRWDAGVVTAAESPMPNDSPLRIAIAAGYIGKSAAASLINLAQKATFHDVMTVIVDKIKMSGDNVINFKRRCVLEAATRQLAFEDATYVVEEETTLATSIESGLDARQIIFNGLRRHYTLARLDKELAPVQSMKLFLPESFDASHFSFDDTAKIVVNRLKESPCHIVDVITSTEVDPSIVLSTIYALIASDSAQMMQEVSSSAQSTIVAPDPVEEKKAPEAINDPPPKPRQAKKRVDVEAKASEIRELVVTKKKLLAEHADHYALLNVDKEADIGSLQKKYFEIAKKLHPDKLQAFGLADIALEAQTLFAAVNKAFSVVGNPKKAHEYKSILAQGGEKAVAKKKAEDEKKAMQILRGEEHYFLGHASLRRNQYKEAATSFQEAVNCNPVEGEYLSDLAWAAWCASGKNDDDKTNSQSLLDKARKLSPKNPNIEFRRGQFFKQVGEVDEAILSFESVIKKMPNHHGAESELRILRKRMNDDKNANAGFFSKKS